MKIHKAFKLISAILISVPILAAMILSSSPLASAADYIPLQFQVQVPNSPLQGSSFSVGTYVSKTGTMSSDLLARYISAIYEYGLGVVAILAAIVLMAGGVLWLSSAGNDTRISQAKEMITGSVIGLVILAGSWIILNTINPDLLKFKSIELQVIQKMSYCCDPAKGNVFMDNKGKCPTGSKECNYEGGERCMNLGVGDDNTFGCMKINLAVDDNGKIIDISGGDKSSSYYCCEFKSGDDEKYCEAVPSGKKCADTSPPEYYTYFTSYNSYCRTRITEAKNCLADECANADRGDDCDDGNGYCYNNICWKGKGKEGEPCGNEAGSKCSKKGSRCDNHDYNGGRNCDGNSFCCQKIVDK